MCRRTMTCRQAAKACRTGRCRHRLMGHRHDAKEMGEQKLFLNTTTGSRGAALNQQHKNCMHTRQSEDDLCKEIGQFHSSPLGPVLPGAKMMQFSLCSQLNRRTLHRKRADRPSLRKARQRARPKAATSRLHREPLSLTPSLILILLHVQSIDQQDCIKD